MKFGKSIRTEARNNRKLAYLDFKHLKKLLKKISENENVEKNNELFVNLLQSELNKVGDSFWKEYKNISDLQETLFARIPHLEIHPDPETYSGMNFEQLLFHFQEIGGQSSIVNGSDASTSAKTSAAFYEYCVFLEKISARCKNLRRCVLWNAVATVKILKKRYLFIKKIPFFRQKINYNYEHETAATVLSKQEWYCNPGLARIISLVEVTTDKLMQRLTGKPPNRDRYQCPICLDVVIDPVCLRTCGHRFCWACLCMAYCERVEGTLERCPCCRSAFPLDPEGFEIDGILSRFLRTFFPDIQSKRVFEQKENIRRRLNAINSNKVPLFSNHCCPDCNNNEIACEHAKNVRDGKPADIDCLSKISKSKKIINNNISHHQFLALPLQVQAVVESLLEDVVFKFENQHRLVTMLQQHIIKEDDSQESISKNITVEESVSKTYSEDIDLPDLIECNSKLIKNFLIRKEKNILVEAEYEAVDAEDDEIEEQFINLHKK